MEHPRLFEAADAESDALAPSRAVNDRTLASIRGLTYIAELITPDEESQLLGWLDQQPWSNELQRRVQHYGYRYDYKARRVDPSMRLGSLPEPLAALGDRLHERGYYDAPPDQVIVNEYQPGQGIAPHKDCEPCFEDTVVSITLAAPCVMRFDQVREGIAEDVWLERRSAVVLQRDARYLWRHSIPARKADVVGGRRVPRRRRVSLTYRRVILSAV